MCLFLWPLYADFKFFNGCLEGFVTAKKYGNNQFKEQAVEQFWMDFQDEEILKVDDPNFFRRFKEILCSCKYCVCIVATSANGNLKNSLG